MDIFGHFEPLEPPPKDSGGKLPFLEPRSQQPRPPRARINTRTTLSNDPQWSGNPYIPIIGPRTTFYIFEKMAIIRYLLNLRGNFVGPQDFFVLWQHTNLHAKIQTSSFKIGRVRASDRAIKGRLSSDFQRSTFNLFPNWKRLKLAIFTLETTLRNLLPTFFGPFLAQFSHTSQFAKFFPKTGHKNRWDFCDQR